MHYAVHGNTAAELIVARADHKKEHMGLTSWKNAPDGKIVKTDVSIAKNYLIKDELTELNEIYDLIMQKSCSIHARCPQRFQKTLLKVNLKNTG